MRILQNKTGENELGSKTFQRPKPTDVAHSPRKLLWFLGLYSGIVLRPHPLHKTMNVTILLIVTLLPVLMLVKAFMNGRRKLLEGSGILWGVVFQLIRLLAYSCSKRITNIEIFLKSEISFNTRTVAQDRFVSRAVKNVKIFDGLIRFGCSLFSVSFAVFVPGDLESLPLAIWIPVEFDVKYWHIYEVVSLTISFFVYAAVESTILALIANAAAQFQILKDNLKNSCKRNPEDSYAKQESRIQFRLKRCIRHHNAILEYYNMMEGSLSIILFGQIFFSIVGICVSGFAAVLVPTRSFPFFWCILYTLGYMMQILSWCIFAEDIVVQSSGIVRSCFVADWYACSTRTKRILLMIMQRATEPTTLKAGPFFTLSLRSFVMIVRSAYTYYAVLHNVYKQ